MTLLYGITTSPRSSKRAVSGVRHWQDITRSKKLRLSSSLPRKMSTRSVPLCVGTLEPFQIVAGQFEIWTGRKISTDTLPVNEPAVVENPNIASTSFPAPRVHIGWELAVHCLF